MEISVPQPLRNEQEVLVTEELTASFLKSGDVSVLATPSMILLMEQTARDSVAPLLPEGYTTVGTRVCIDHLNAAPSGVKVNVIAELQAQEQRKLVFKVETWWNDVKIGEGIHERFIVNHERFLARLKEQFKQ